MRNMWCWKIKNKKLFGQIAVEKGLATEEDIEKALEIQKVEQEKRIERKIGAILFEKGVLAMEDINTVLKEQYPWAWFHSIFEKHAGRGW